MSRFYEDQVLGDVDRDTNTVGSGRPAAGDPPTPNPDVTETPPYTPPPAAPLSDCVQNLASPGSLTGTVQRDTDLPDTATDGQVYKVIGGAETGFVSYYVRRVGTAWEETVAPGSTNLIDPLTMPHALIRKADGTFELKPFCWKPRQVGDSQNNPAPSFVGRTIRDVFFYQNRLGFLSDETAVMSVVGDYGNFWRRTVLDALDADVLSVAATTTDVALLEFATTFNDGIMLFSGQRQFSLSNGDAGTSISSIEIRPVTDYTLASGVRPVGFGDQVYFATDEGGHSTIQEYTRLDGRDAKDAADITAHVPGLLPAGVSKLIPMKGLNGLITITANSSDPNRVFAYQFFWDGDRKVISAWRRWTFGGGHVLSGAFADGQLTLVVRRQDQPYLERMDLRSGAVSASQVHMLYLDRQVTLTGTYDIGSDTTTFTFPYAPDPIKLRIMRTLEADVPESMIDGRKISVVDNIVTVEGHEAHPVTAGEVFRTAVRLSRQFPQDYQGRPLESGRLQIRSMTITSAQTPFYRVEIKPYGSVANLDENSATRVYNISAQRLGNANFVLGEQTYATGAVPFMVGADASVASITLTNDGPFSSYFVSAEWEGLYFSRAR